MARPFPVAILVAVGLHGGAAAFASSIRRSSLPLPAEAPPTEVIELSIESTPEPRPVVTPEPSEAPRSPEALPEPTRSPEPSRAPEPSRVATANPGRVEAVPELSPSVDPVPSPVVSPFAEGDTTEARGQKAIASLMQGGTWLLNPGSPGAGAAAGGGTERPVGPRVSEDPDRASKLLRESLDRGNQSKGLGFGGPVATAAHQASLTRTAPVQGGVVFEVTTDAAGSVISVNFSNPSGGDWSGVASALRAILASKKLRVPEGAKGVAVAVRVQATQQLPSGAKPTDSPVKVDGVGLGVSGKFDLADLSGKVSRVVSARVVSERRL